MIPDETPSATSLAFTPDLGALVAGTSTGRIMIWDLVSRTTALDQEASAGDRELISQAARNVAAETKNFTDDFVFQAALSQRLSVPSVAVSPLGGLICAGTGSGKILLKTIKGRSVTSWGEDSGPVYSVEFHNDGQEVSWLAGEKLTLRDLLTDHVISSMPLPSDIGYYDKFAVGHAGAYVAVADFSRITICRRDSGDIGPLNFRWHDGYDKAVYNAPIAAIAATGDGPGLAVLNDQGLVQRWDLGSARPTMTDLLSTTCTGPMATLISSTDAVFALNQDEDGAVRFWDSRTTTAEILPLADSQPGAHLTACTVDHGGTRLAAGFSDGSIALWPIAGTKGDLTMLKPA